MSKQLIEYYLKRKSLYIIIITLIFLTIGLYAETEIYYKTDFDRGDVITVLITGSDELYTLELVNSSNQYITGNIFFPLYTIYFNGQAALIGIDSTMNAGKYRLLIKNGDGGIESTGEILVHENIFKKENIPLNYANTSLRTDPDPKITLEAVEIHEIYGTSELLSVRGIKPFNIPVDNGIITSRYGDRRKFLYSNGDSSGSIHTGVDIAAPFGSGIIAGSPGRVVFAGKRIITGNSIVIEYLPGVYGVFFHMNEVFVDLGDTVTEDTEIGTLGSSGLATGPHLHWELRVGGTPVDPYPLLENGLIDNSLIMSIVSSHTAE
ncbi:MAG: M23 family metallopeptidase [Spirochaetales bacterium]|nr:M23 family metallopeptidase [Spirochaetales bacterium]